MAKSRSKKYSKKSTMTEDDIEVKSDFDLPKLTKLLKNKKNRIIFVYIGAEEWCGPCQKFRPLYDEYKKIPGRKVPTVHIDHKMVPKTFASKAKIDGFPSGVIYSPEDGSFSSFKNEEGKETNSMPSIRDKEAMTAFLKADPTELLKANNTNTENEGADSQSLVRTATTRQRLIESGKKAIENRESPLAETLLPSPPNVGTDTIKPMNVPQKEAAPSTGGSLFQALLRASKGLGPPTRRASAGKRRTRKR